MDTDLIFTCFYTRFFFFFQDANIKQKLNKKQLVASVAMEGSPIKVPSENDETPVKDEAQEVDEDTLQGEVKLHSQLPIILACDHTNGYFSI